MYNAGTGNADQYLPYIVIGSIFAAITIISGMAVIIYCCRQNHLRQGRVVVGECGDST